MTAMELATASQFNIGVKVMVLNNEFQGMVVQWQGLYLFFFMSTHVCLRDAGRPIL
jgi:thiamine pyrophosphate-dependent acetolactate synthase large subunit-like protein